MIVQIQIEFKSELKWSLSPDPNGVYKEMCGNKIHYFKNG